MRNLYKLYYRDYFKHVDFKALDSVASKRAVLEANRMLTAPVNPRDLKVGDLGEGVRTFELQVLYPGLVTGVGIQHEASVEGEFKLGLHIDYTTGLPVIYGSSIKGVVRSYFADTYNGTADVNRLIDDIFEKNKSIYDKDIFYDAVIVAASADNKILASDAIASHGTSDPHYPLIEPNPISFVKIAPGVKLSFRFRLVDTRDEAGNVLMLAEEKLQLFKTILTTYGIGAKTNTGYGQLI